MENRNYKIYLHISPSKKVYVGQTKASIRKRWGCGNRYEPCVLFQKAIDKYGWDNIEHKVLFENLSQLDADMIETDLIYYYKKIGMSYNIADGGQGARGVKVSPEESKRRRERMLGANNPFYGKTFSPEVLAHLSEIRKGRVPWNKGKKIPEEYCRKNSESHIGVSAGAKNGMFGKHRTEKEKQHLRELHSIKIYQFDMNGNYIAEYPSIKAAAVSIGAKSSSHISECARGLCAHAHHYKWSFTKDAKLK